VRTPERTKAPVLRACGCVGWAWAYGLSGSRDARSAREWTACDTERTTATERPSIDAPRIANHASTTAAATASTTTACTTTACTTTSCTTTACTTTARRARLWLLVLVVLVVLVVRSCHLSPLSWSHSATVTAVTLLLSPCHPSCHRDPRPFVTTSHGDAGPRPSIGERLPMALMS
jgi:hypothetical protein